MTTDRSPHRLTDAEVSAFWAERLKRIGRSPEIDFKGQETLLKMWRDRVEVSGHKIAIECLGHGLTFRQIDEMSDSVAAYLLERPFLSRGDRVAIMMPNLSQYIIVVYGILKAGMVVVNCNPLYTTTEIENQLKNSEAKILFTIPNVAKASADADVPTLQAVVISDVGDMLPFGKRQLVNFAIHYIKRMVPRYRYSSHLIVHKFRSLLGTPSADALRRIREQEKNVRGEDIAFLQYTGGTTGVSKGAILSHGGMSANIHQMMDALPRDFENKPIELLKDPSPRNIFCLHPLPFYHVYGLISCLLTSAGGGAGTVTLPNPREISKLIKLLNRQDVGLMTAINTLLKGILTHPDLALLKLPPDFIVIVGGMATSPDVGKEWFEKTGTSITEGFGLTESSPLVSLVDPFHPRCGVAGYALASTLVKLRDEEGHDLPLGAGVEVRGELLVKGPQRMLGYFRNPEETQRMISDDGFLQTGDVATIASDGMIEIVDRKKDMIIVSGFNVYPNEIEARALETRLLVECAAIGKKDPKTGERVVLYAVPLDPRLAPEELGEMLKASLTNYKRPSEIIFVKELPKSAVGKILRREVRVMAQKLDEAS